MRSDAAQKLSDLCCGYPLNNASLTEPLNEV